MHMHNQFAAVLANARKPPLASKTTSTNSVKGTAASPSRLVRSNSSCLSSNALSKGGQRSLFSRLHCYQKQEKLQKKEVTERIQKERFLAMLHESLQAPIMEEEKPRVNYKHVRSTKSVTMKKEHTTAKIDRINSKPFFGNQKYLMVLAKRRAFSELKLRRNKDIHIDLNEESARPLDIKHNTVTEWGPPALEQEKEEELAKLTARRATVKILKNFDELLKDKKYQVTGTPKFEFDSKRVAKGFCDTYINEDIGLALEKKSRAAKSHEDSARIPSQRSTSAIISRRQTMFKAKDARQFAYFCQQVEEAWRRDQSADDTDSNQDFEERSAQVESDRWWPKKCFRPDEIHSPPMLKKSLRNIGYLSHSNLPRVNQNLQLIDSDDEVTSQKQLARFKPFSKLHKVRKNHKSKQIVFTVEGSSSKQPTETIPIPNLYEDNSDSQAVDRKDSNKNSVSSRESSSTSSMDSERRKRRQQKRKEKEERIVTKSISQMLASKYPKNKFLINLPSLEAQKRQERRKAKGILKESNHTRVLNSSRRANLKDKIRTFIDMKQSILNSKLQPQKKTELKRELSMSSSFHGHQQFKQRNFMTSQELEEYKSRKLNDEMLRQNKSISRQFSEERLTLQRLRKNCLPNHGESESEEQEDSFDEILERMNKIPMDLTSAKIMKQVEEGLYNKTLGRSEPHLNSAGHVLTKYVPIMHPQVYATQKRNNITPQPRRPERRSLSPVNEDKGQKYSRQGPFRLRNQSPITPIFTRVVPEKEIAAKYEDAKHKVNKPDAFAEEQQRIMAQKVKKLKVVKIKKTPKTKQKKNARQLPPQEEVVLDGRPVSASIMDGDSYKLRKYREDLYRRINKTLNIDYNPRLLKPFLEKLAKRESVNKLKPLGMASEGKFPADLRMKFQFMLSPMAQDDSVVFNIMGGGSEKQKTDYAFLESHKY